MGVFHGKTAKIDFGGVVESTIAWSLTATADVVESTAMGDTWQTFELGFNDCSMTFEGNGRTARDAVAQIGSEASCKMYINATYYFGCNAICTSLTETASKDDIGKISYSFEMDDAAGMVYG